MGDIEYINIKINEDGTIVEIDDNGNIINYDKKGYYETSIIDITDLGNLTLKITED